MTYQPVIIIGAPRSGTNMLRDVLTRLPGFATWPCDEINFAWKHGNMSWPTDDLRIGQVNSRVRRFMRRQFDGVAKRYQAEFVVEKTCANSLRVSFVRHTVPDAKFLLLLRDGPDAVASTMKRWKTPVPGGAYYARKLKYVALVDRPRVVARAMSRRLGGVLGGSSKGWSSWGPMFPALVQAAEEGRPLAELCAMQWSRCVESSIEQLRGVPEGCWRAVRYEAFVASPEDHVRRIADFLGAKPQGTAMAKAVASVSKQSVGKAVDQLDASAMAAVEGLIANAESLSREMGKMSW